MDNNLTWEIFEQSDMRIGTVIEVLHFPEAIKPAYKLRIDFGHEIGIKQSSAQITVRYNPEDLLGKQVIAVVNFPSKKIGPWQSECLVLGITTPQGVVLLSADSKVSNGLRIH